MVNFCTFHAALVKPVGWRPTFKVKHHPFVQIIFVAKSIFYGIIKYIMFNKFVNFSTTISGQVWSVSFYAWLLCF